MAKAKTKKKRKKKENMAKADHSLRSPVLRLLEF